MHCAWNSQHSSTTYCYGERPTIRSSRGCPPAIPPGAGGLMTLAAAGPLISVLPVGLVRGRTGTTSYHMVSMQKMPLSEEARRVFDEAKTGRLQSQRHGRSKDHDVYN